MEISAKMRALVPADVLVQELEGESVLLNLSSGRYFGLNKVGTRIWKACTTSASLQEASDALVSEYDVDPERLRHDLQELVEKLVEHGLLEVDD
jgi:Coenzyme PQQ synthesis protein D (PqqD)